MGQSKSIAISPEKVVEAIERTEKKTGYIFCAGELMDIINYAMRKCELNCKDDEDYFYLVLEDELKWYLIRNYINMRGEENGRRELQCAKYVE